MKSIFTVILSFISLYTVVAQDIAHDVQAIASKHKAVGVTYVVVKKGEIIHQGAVGYKSLEDKSSITPSKDLFRIASISKSFTATAFMQLIDQGKVSLNDDFGHLIGFPVRNPLYPDKVITLRMVLSHTSSINDVNGYFDLDVINPSKNKDWHKSYNKYEPGTQYEYCNLNFNMGGAVLERLTNVRFDQYIKKQILTPLGLEGGYCVDSLRKVDLVPLYTYISSSDSFEVQPAAYNPRTNEINNYVLGYSTPIFSPTGGMKISSVDLAKYMMMHMNSGKVGKKKIMSKKSSKLMQTKLSEKEGYGLALREVTNFIDNKYMVGHTGSAYGLFSSMFFDPKEKFGIVVITNGCVPATGSNASLTKEVSNYLYNTLIK